MKRNEAILEKKWGSTTTKSADPTNTGVTRRTTAGELVAGRGGVGWGQDMGWDSEGYYSCSTQTLIAVGSTKESLHMKPLK